MQPHEIAHLDQGGVLVRYVEHRHIDGRVTLRILLMWLTV